MRRVDLNAVVQEVLERLGARAALPGPCRAALDAGLPHVLGDAEMLASAVADLVRHGDRLARRRGGELLVETERVASVVLGESVARVRVALRGGESLPEAGPMPGLARAARIAAGHGGGLVHGAAPGAAMLDLPGLAAGRPAIRSAEAGA